MMERMNKSVSTEDVEPNSWEVSPEWTEEPGRLQSIGSLRVGHN